MKEAKEDLGRAGNKTGGKILHPREKNNFI